jgi:hypothetical protein
MRSYEPHHLERALGLNPGFAPDDFSPEEWVANRNNALFVHGHDVGLATYEYEGLYNVHWFFENARGREAIRLAHAMLKELFETTSAQCVRGMTRAHMRGVRWLAKHVGMKSLGIIEMADGPNELMLLSREDFYKKIGDDNG